MKYLCVLVLLFFGYTQANADIISYLSEPEKDKLLLEYIEKDSVLSKEKELRNLISDATKYENVVRLIESGSVNSEFVFDNGLSILEFSALMNNVELVTYLVNKYEQKQSAKQHSLELSCANRYHVLVKFFIEKGVDINSTNKSKDWLCVFSSVKNMDHELLEILLEANVDLAVKNENGYTPKEYLSNLSKDLSKTKEIVK